jgi:putative ABC transport system permease protein
MNRELAVDSANKSIIDDQAIMRIKDYIHNKHPDLNSSQKASLLANAIHRAVESHLPDFQNPATKAWLRRQLLAKMGMGERFVLMTEDILEACLSLDLQQSGNMEPLTAWMAKHTGLLLSEQRLQVLAGQVQQVNKWEALSAVVPMKRVIELKWLSSLGRIACLLAVIAAVMGTDSLQVASLPQERYDSFAPPSTQHSLQAAGLPDEYVYHAMNGPKLREWLRRKKSLLAEEPYFSTIINTAKENDIHPLLLFAITGQEQGFVPTAHKKAKQIANNPFNIYNSWQSYNTTIADSARIAAQTIRHISQNRPIYSHPIAWLNTVYAEDPNWWVGVNAIFEQMQREIQ